MNLWGNTPASNFHELFEAHVRSAVCAFVSGCYDLLLSDHWQGLSEKKTLNVHIVGAGDARHVLKTMSRNFKAQAKVGWLLRSARHPAFSSSPLCSTVVHITLTRSRR